MRCARAVGVVRQPRFAARQPPPSCPSTVTSTRKPTVVSPSAISAIPECVARGFQRAGVTTSWVEATRACSAALCWAFGGKLLRLRYIRELRRPPHNHNVRAIRCPGWQSSRCPRVKVPWPWLRAVPSRSSPVGTARVFAF
eukprot:scaffold13914_cov69-Phaeocystis_antarctica.AAC.2